MSTTRAPISVEQYLRTRYRPDCDYVDGEVVDRNLGERDHGRLQTAIAARARFRIPGICVVLSEPEVQILTKPAFICIEILPPEDRLSGIQERVNDFLEMGAPYVWVPYVWVFDPRMKRAYAATAEGLREAQSGVLKTENPAIELRLGEVFA